MVLWNNHVWLKLAHSGPLKALNRLYETAVCTVAKTTYNPNPYNTRIGHPASWMAGKWESVIFPVLTTGKIEGESGRRRREEERGARKKRTLLTISGHYQSRTPTLEALTGFVPRTRHPASSWHPTILPMVRACGDGTDAAARGWD